MRGRPRLCYVPTEKVLVGSKYLARQGDVPHLRVPMSLALSLAQRDGGCLMAATYLLLLIFHVGRGQKLHRLPPKEDLDSDKLGEQEARLTHDEDSLP